MKVHAPRISQQLGDAGHTKYRSTDRFSQGTAGYKVIAERHDRVVVYDWPVGRPDVLQRWAITLRNEGYVVEVDMTKGIRNWHLVVTR